MYTNVSSSFLNKIAQPSRHFEARFYDGTTLLDLEIKHIDVTTGTCGSSNLAVGCAFAGYLSVTARATDIQLEGKELRLELGLLLDGGTYEYIPFGYWTVQKPTVQKDVMSFTAVDRMASKFNDDYSTSLTYPTTIANVLSELATATGVTINCNLQTSVQMPVAIEDMSQRGALAVIANCLLACAWVDRNGAVNITAYGNSSTQATIDYDYVKEQPDMDEQKTLISGVRVYTVDGQTDTWIETGTDHMVTTSNMYATQSMLTAAAGNIVGLNYDGGSVRFMGNPLLDPSDTITFNDGEEDRLVPCMEIAQEFDGGLLTTVSAPGSFEVTESTIQTGPIAQEMERRARATAEAQAMAEEALTTAESAATDAENARVLATGKCKIFYSDTAPTSGMNSGDMWMDTAHGNSLYQYNGSAWTLRQLGQGSIAAGSITADEISVNNLSVIAENVGTVNAGILTSADWEYDYEHLPIYSTAGMRISLNDKYIRTPNFAVVGGNLYARNGTFSGSVVANSGTIGGYTISSTANTGTTANGGHVYANSLYTHSNGTETVGTTETAYEYEAGIAGGGAYNNAAFYIKKMLSGGSWSSSEHVFYVRNDGYLYATKGSISGGIITTGISASNISTGTLTAIAINNGNGTFSVSSAGVLNATSATISGAITATSGNIGGFSIENNYQIVYRDTMTAGTAGTQYAVFMRATDNGSAPSGSTAAFGVVHRGYNGSTYDASWVSDFIVRHDGDVYCYGGSLHISNQGNTAGKITFPNAVIYSDTDGIIVSPNETFSVSTGVTSGKLSDLYFGANLRIYARTGIEIVTPGATQGSRTNGDITITNTSGNVTISASNVTLNSSGQMEISSTLQTGGNINIVSTASAAYAVGVQNAAKKVQLYIASNGNMGVYNATDSHYVIYEDADNVIRMPQVYAKTNSGAANIYIDSYGRTYRSTSSSKRYKKDIKPLADWKSVLDIQVVSFAYRKGYLSEDDQRYGVSVPGLIAEDVAEHYAIAAEMSDGKAEDWNIRYIVPPMLAVEQDHERRIKELEEEIRILKGGVK